MFPFYYRKTITAATALLFFATALATFGHPASSHADGTTSISAWRSNVTATQDVERQPDITIGAVSDGTINIRVDDSLQSQRYLGVGASFTDSSASLLVHLKTDQPNRYWALMNRVFSTTTGDGISLWRIPMGASDFTSAPSHWTNADRQGSNNNLMENFGLTDYDLQYIIPVVKDALSINPDIRIIASPWSAPAWMKSNQSLICHTNGQDGKLLPEYYQAWADYFVQWIQNYQAEGVNIWAITPQNEPQYCPDTYTGMSWNSNEMATWVNQYLYPTLRSAGLYQKIFGYDHNFTNSQFAEDLIELTNSSKLQGIAWHCYDNDADPAYMTKVKNIDPDRTVIETECSSNAVPTDIIRFSTADMMLLSFQNYAQGVVLWNFSLNDSGGPHLGGCVGCTPTVPINSINGLMDWRAHPNLSSLAHVSRFVKPDATVIDSTTNAHGIVTAAFKNPDSTEVLVATNTTDATVNFTVTWNRQGSFTYSLEPRGIVTFKGNIPSAPALSSLPTDGKTYRIVSKTTEKPLGTCAGSTANGACIVQWSDDGDPDQRWRLQTAANGYFNIINIASTKALDLPDGNTSNGTQLQQWEITGIGNQNQQWQIQRVDNEWFKIINRASGKAVDITDGNVSDGTVIQQWESTENNPNQMFKLLPYD